MFVNTAGQGVATGLAVTSADMSQFVKLGVSDSGPESQLVWESDIFVSQTHREARNELTLSTDIWLRLVKYGNATYSGYWRVGPYKAWTPLNPAISRNLGLNNPRATIRIGIFARKFKSQSFVTTALPSFDTQPSMPSLVNNTNTSTKSVNGSNLSRTTTYNGTNVSNSSSNNSAMLQLSAVSVAADVIQPVVEVLDFGEVDDRTDVEFEAFLDEPNGVGWDIADHNDIEVVGDTAAPTTAPPSRAPVSGFVVRSNGSNMSGNSSSNQWQSANATAQQTTQQPASAKASSTGQSTWPGRILGIKLPTQTAMLANRRYCHLLLAANGPILLCLCLLPS